MGTKLLPHSSLSLCLTRHCLSTSFSIDVFYVCPLEKEGAITEVLISYYNVAEILEF